MLDRLKGVSRMIEDTKKGLEERQLKREEAKKSTLEKKVEEMQEEIDYILRASDSLKLTSCYTWDLQEQEKDITSTQVTGVELFKTGILIETTGEGERYTEGCTDDLEELEGASYKILEEIEEEEEDTFYVVAKDPVKEKVEKRLFLDVIPFDLMKGRYNIFIEIYQERALIEVLSRSLFYRIEAKLDPKKVDFSKVNTSTKTMSPIELKSISREDLIKDNEVFMDNLKTRSKLSNLDDLAKLYG